MFSTITVKVIFIKPFKNNLLFPLKNETLIAQTLRGYIDSPVLPVSTI